MEPIYSQTFTVRNYELGPHQAAHVRTLMYYLGEAADSHFQKLGVSIHDLLEKSLLWVLVGYRLEIARYPQAGETVTVNTWYPGRQERFYLRDFEVYGSNGESNGPGVGNVIATATTSWALIDAVKRRPVDNTDGLPDISILDKRAVEGGIRHLPAVDSPQRSDGFTVGSGCLDMYSHVNHVFYIQWALDSVLPGIERGNLPFSIEAVFKGEGVARDKLVVALQSGEEESTWLHSITREEDGKEISRLRTRWGKTEIRDKR
jgi:medium-chain acyl-[acyl-carrier-protein] hydrolase